MICQWMKKIQQFGANKNPDLRNLNVVSQGDGWVEVLLSFYLDV